jgi:hypothetical protein
MGRSNRIRPKRLGKKLEQIRFSLGLDRSEIIQRLEYKETKLYPQNIWSFEKSEREPNLLIILAYSRLYGISTDILIDDSMELP